MNFADIAALTIHDVKNSLAQLAGKAEARGDAETVRTVLDASDTLTRLLIFYRSENGILAPNINAHSPADLLAELGDNVHSAGIRVEIDTHTAPVLWFYDETLIRMILANAIQNALRYARQRIVLAATERADFLEFSVQDDGPGFAQELLLEDAQAAVSQQGTGLGLRLARSIAAGHSNQGRQGQIQLNNQSGAVFALLLPR